MDNERLVYACAGMAVEPNSPAAAIAAAAIAQQQQEALPDAVITESAAVVDAVPVQEAATEAAVVDPAAGAKHHHHHHHRHLLQAGTEWVAAWKVSIVSPERQACHTKPVGVSHSLFAVRLSRPKGMSSCWPEREQHSSQH